MMKSLNIQKKYFKADEKKAFEIFTKRNTEKYLMLQRMKTDWPILINTLTTLSRLIPLFVMNNKTPVIHTIYERVLYKHSSLLKDNVTDNERYNVLISFIINTTIELCKFTIKSTKKNEEWDISSGIFLDTWVAKQSYEVVIENTLTTSDLKETENKILHLITTQRQRELSSGRR